ncbi:OprD family outer membrane porin [Paraburkholderia bonniea]|uniref:OprD family outer membrane porin n=1 Tax=Paraburkholderia bonniea TaxID=2152891 RepID=UPI001290DC35|nr:OprD family outer membrane porin [Paraburkholderia bonniea]WJF91940.1 OprD family outer membrane porin [Paraburkholderia bonniea]WJF95259.1 OprD family outer membrane porin [Paraburkholderia bonniea]
MRHQGHTSGAQNVLWLALGRPMVATVVATAATAALADEPPAPPNPAPLTQLAQANPGAPATSVAAGMPDMNSPLIKVEKNRVNLPEPTLSSQAKSQGLIGDSHLNLLWRNYSDYMEVSNSSHRHAWIQGVQANYESGYTQGLIGFGFDASLFAALKLDGGKGAGNMVHVGKDGDGQNQLAWAYPGMYDIKGRISETVLKYGLQIVSNPFLDPHDNRALPPTFLGASLVSKDVKDMSLEAGSFTKVDARGHTNLSSLSTSYGGVKFSRLSYFGGSWDYAPSGTLSLYADQADDIWRQYYASVSHSIGDPRTVKWSGMANVYSTHDTGAARQGHINNNAYSLTLSAQHGASGLLLGYQQVLGDQFFDYVNETNGIYLSNSMDVDYNAPHERSLQLRYTLDGSYLGVPGLRAMLWGVMGWDADASAGAAANASASSPLHDLYWKNGEPVHGRHHEIGFVPSYTLQSGRFKDTKITFMAMWHVGQAHYSDSNNMEYRLVVNLPMKVF